MKSDMINENYFTNKLNFIVDKGIELKTFHNNSYILNTNIALKLVSENFNGKNDTERYIVNTFKYHVAKIAKPVFENNILLGQFVNGVSISIINALMSGDKYSRDLFKHIVDLLCRQIKFDTQKTLTTPEYNKLKVMLEEYFVSKPPRGLVAIQDLTIKPEILELHKRAYLNALLQTFESRGKLIDFRLNLELNIVKCYEIELTKKAQAELDSKNSSIENTDEEYESYYTSDSNDYNNATDSPYYNDELDMDQQSPEFWDSL